MQKEDTRNTIIFVISAVVLLVVYQVFIIGPSAERKKAELARQAPPAAAQAQAGPQVPLAVTRQAAVAATPRIPIETPALRGSLSLRGGRIDDLYLTRFR